MLRNERGSEDGFTVKFYEKDESYEVATGLGSTLVKSGAAERTGGDQVAADPLPEATEPAAPIGTKAKPGAPENRAISGAPSNKTAA